MDLRRILLGAFTVGAIACCQVVYAQTPSYTNVEQLTTNGTLAAAFESNLDNYLLPLELLQIANSVYGVGLNTSGTASSSPQIDFVTMHQSTYCLAQLPAPWNLQVEGAWCQNQNSNPALQMGDIRASVLLDPLVYPDSGSGGSALNTAAVNYIKNITVPFPSKTMANYISAPQTFAKNSTQQTAYANYMAGQAQVSMARYVLDEIYAMRVTGADVGTVSGSGSPPSGYATQSLLMTMENEATRRFEDPNYVPGFLTVAATQQIDLIRDLVAMESFRLWMDYYAYRQNERIAALLATMVANNANGALAAVNMSQSMGGQ